MADGVDKSSTGSAAPSKLSVGQRFLAALPSLKRDRERSVGERVRGAILKPVPEGGSGRTQTAPGSRSEEEVRAAIKTMDDRERLVGVVGAPVAAAIGVLVVSYLIGHDPSAIVNHHANKLHVNPSLYLGNGAVVAALCVVILGSALARKRLFLAVALTLYGLSVTNLGFFLFGVPFIMWAAWLFVRAYRLNTELRTLTEGGSSARGPAARSRNGKAPARAPGKRATPPRRVPPKAR